MITTLSDRPAPSPLSNELPDLPLTDDLLRRLREAGL